MRFRSKQTLFLVVVIGLLVFGTATIWIGGRLVAAAPSLPGPVPKDLPIEQVSFPSQSGSTIQAWYAHGRKGGGAIVLMHAVRANRATLVPRARFLWKAGYSVLLFDFQAHGTSPG